ncbi:MAG: hypothetical protein JWM31_2746 [Solirubrobacterales bacterium]|nr:hypothetical protein [Solirubrobacterales bacterium]
MDLLSGRGGDGKHSVYGHDLESPPDRARAWKHEKGPSRPAECVMQTEQRAYAAGVDEAASCEVHDERPRIGAQRGAISVLKIPTVAISSSPEIFTKT